MEDVRIAYVAVDPMAISRSETNGGEVDPPLVPRMNGGHLDSETVVGAIEGRDTNESRNQKSGHRNKRDQEPAQRERTERGAPQLKGGG